MKDPTWIRPKLNWPMTSCGDRLVKLVLSFLIGGAVVFAVATERWLVASLSVVIGFSVLILWWSRRKGTEAGQAGFFLGLPLVLGFATSFHPAVGSTPIFVGVALSVGVGLWYRILRHPPHYRSAVKRFYAGDMARTLELLKTSIEQNPMHWQSLYLRAVAKLHLARFVEAEQDARAVLRLQPNHHICHAALGSALIPQGQYAEAKAAYSRALELARAYGINHYGKGVACFRLQEFQEAVALLRTAVRGKLPYLEQRLLANYYLGQSLQQIGQDAKAQSAFRTMKRFRQGYEQVVARYQDAPDLPGVADLRQELQEIKMRLDDSAT